jgi:DegV family protein with EDD domain
MRSVGIVCDSTCDLGLEWFADHEVEMVPLKIQIDGDTFLDWVDLSPEAFYERQKSAVEMPTTSQPSPADFTAAYERAGEGADGIVAITLTSELSGTHQSAEIAAAESAVPVHLIDTKLVSVATGLAVKAAVSARDAGGSVDDVRRAAEWTARNTRLFFVLDTLDYLVKGGRAGRAQGLAASVLNIKPILTFAPEGIIEPFKKVKGLSKALTALAGHVAEASKESRLRIAFLHAVAPDLLDELRSEVDDAGADYELDCIGEIGCVIGNYAGAGAVGVAYVPASSD